MSRDPEITSRIMAKVRNKDSRAELALRQELHRRGARFRIHARDVTGTPDIVWRGLKVAVFVDGDMWHGNEHHRRGLESLADLYPSNTAFWVAKIERNITHDHQVNETLRAKGWSVLRIWESEVIADVDTAAERVLQALAKARQSASSGGHSRTDRG